MRIAPRARDLTRRTVPQVPARRRAGPRALRPVSARARDGGHLRPASNNRSRLHLSVPVARRRACGGPSSTTCSRPSCSSAITRRGPLAGGSSPASASSAAPWRPDRGARRPQPAGDRQQRRGHGAGRQHAAPPAAAAMAVVADGQVLGLVELPVAGLMDALDDRDEEVSAEVRRPWRRAWRPRSAAPCPRRS